MIEIALGDAVSIALGGAPAPAPGIMLDLTISLGNLLSLFSMLGIVALYIIDTRYSSKGARGEVRKITDAVNKLSKEMKEHADEDTARFEQIRRETGEVVAAIRTKVNEVELYARDTFVRRDTLRDAMDSQSRTLELIVTDLRSWMTRIEARVNSTFNNESD